MKRRRDLRKCHAQRMGHRGHSLEEAVEQLPEKLRSGIRANSATSRDAGLVVDVLRMSDK